MTAAFIMIGLCGFMALLMMSGCASSGSTATAPASQGGQPEGRIGFEEARAMFAARGVQPGQTLPAMNLVDLDGRPADIAAMYADQPLVLVTASLTCNVARRQQKDVDALREQYSRARVVVIYTIDAHPQGDVCPYIEKEWVPEDNVRDRVLVRQPTSLDERLKVARDYQQRFSTNATVLVDGMDNAAWKALGQAPNLGLLVDERGIVRLRQGWFEPRPMQAGVQVLLSGQG